MMLFRQVLLALTIVLISGCATTSTKVPKCLDNHCAREMSSPTQLVIWWGPALRDELKKDPDTTVYDLSQYD
ncbi:hypothetical protein [Vibrio porteresiae]|uniref:Type III secretion protein HrpT n=1 Tax=Vibrio porteresiae DSM 19223 TaxID=1123496 RepID=A0ABZ0QC70_9VIBR|nr:hypothetical protein [Vibrio porteresiae]WPC73500.1 hypothetical protein R8Z52_15480 [Vibrio porteresiae DSM 19223]